VSVPVLVCHSSDPSWLEERRKGVTASEVPTILHGSALRLWSDKIGMTERAPVEGEHIDIGHEAEPILMGWLSKQIGRPVVPCGSLYRHGSMPWLMATPDAFVEGIDGTTEGLAEIKTRGSIRAWEDGGVPQDVWEQVQIQLEVMDLPVCHVAVLGGLGGSAPLARRWSRIDRMPEWFEGVRPKLEAFHEAVAKQTPPPPTGSEEDWEALNEVYRPVPESVVTLDGEWIDLDVEYAALVESMRADAAKASELKARIAAAMGTAARGVLPNGVVWTRNVRHRKGYTVAESEYIETRRKEA
jgi:predicted phage-related endonuclease